MEEHRSKFQSRGGVVFLFVLFLVGMIGGLGVFRPEGMAVRRLVGQFLLPAGLIWLLLISLVASALMAGRRGLAALAALVLVAYTAAGNSWVADQLSRQVEGRYLAIDPFEEGEFDAVFVLGGVTNSALNGRSQVTSSGDRVVLAAQLFHKKKAQWLVTAGGELAEEGKGGSGGLAETREIWERLGVPGDRILQVPGSTTEEEMASIRELSKDRKWKRMGLITSAWHMRRAMQLADANGLELKPLPADFRTDTAQAGSKSLVPSADNFYMNQLLIKEILATEVQK